MSAPRRLRISAGLRRGLKLHAPDAIRPTSARLREALFDLWGGRLAGCRFLDLFAGSGAVGIEAASRGAARVVLVEGDRRVFGVLERNRVLADLAGVVALRLRLPEDLASRLAADERFDLIFADPPYGFARLPEVVSAVAPRVARGGEIALESRWSDVEPAPPGGWVVARQRRYGDSALTLLRRAQAPAPAAAPAP